MSRGKPTIRLNGNNVDVLYAWTVRHALAARGYHWIASDKVWRRTFATAPDAETEMSYILNNIHFDGIQLGAPEQAQEQTEQATASTQDGQDAAKTQERHDNQDAAKTLIKSLSEFMQAQPIAASTPIDADTVRDIVRSELSGIAPRTLAVVHPDGRVKELKGTLPACYDRVLKLAMARLPIMLVGPTGCGKTHLAARVAEALDLPFSFISCSAGMSEAQLSGYLLPTAEGGRFEYVPVEFVRRYEDGGVFLLDEMDSADANLLTFINASLANGHLSIPQRHNAPVAAKHKDFVLIAAANTFGTGANRQYVGRNQLDEATLDRFRAATVEMAYDQGVEEAIVTNKAILAWGRQIRERIATAKMRRILSTRFLRDLSILATIHEGEFNTPAYWTASLTAGWTADEKARIN